MINVTLTPQTKKPYVKRDLNLRFASCKFKYITHTIPDLLQKLIS